MLYTIKYTDDMPANFAGTATGWAIKIRPVYKGDLGLLEHEKVHVRQFWRIGMFYFFLYRFSKTYRLKCEVEAYREQLNWPPAIEDRTHYIQYYAEFIADKGRYGLDINVEAVVRLLS